MAGFYLTTGNDQLQLVARLGDQLRSRQLSRAFEPEYVMVQSMGMQRWISLQLAGQLGIAANFRYLFPNQLLEEVFKRIVPDYQQETLFSREAVSWKIMELLPALLGQAAFQPLHNYLVEAGEISPVKTWQLSGRIAYLFDQYCMYRPEMIGEWDTGGDAHWQADLWRSLRENGLETHLPLLRSSFFHHISDPQFCGSALPERITVFGITALPPLHIEVLSALSRFCDVSLYFLNPSPEYWGDILSRREMARRMEKYADPGLTAEILHMEQGNPLLASLGKTGRCFFDLLQETDFNTAGEQDAFIDPQGRTLLGIVQSDIFHLYDPDRDDYPPRSIPGEDESIQIHSCHSRMREVEVLQDRLKLIMSNNAALRPGDVLVMAPDINLYAPMIRAVFVPDNSSGRYLPYSIADRVFSRESKVIQWFLKLLEIPGSRFNLSDILELLESEAILARFEISENEIHLLQDWLISSNIRWGMDSTHKQACGTPAVHQNTWEFGLDRLLLGLAMPDEGETPFFEILPFDRIEGSQGVLLGKFISFFTELEQLARLGSGAETAGGNGESGRSLQEWSEYLTGVIDRFFPDDEEWNDELQSLLRVVDELGSPAEQLKTGHAVQFEVIRLYLSEQLGQGGSGFGFLGAGITFCSMLPMRSIPFKVVALLGMNDQEFPRQSRPLGFDLMASAPQPGDRSPKDDDRYLFLEAVLSAGEILYISYVGQNIKDNSRIPPSIVVSELIRYCVAVAERSGFEIEEQLVHRHRLQAFSPHYFKTPGPTGFSDENLQAARVLAKGSLRKPAAFIDRLPEPEESWQYVELEQLIAFFSNPCRFLLRERLGLYLEDRSVPVADAEPFAVGSLERYQLDRELLETCLADREADTVLSRLGSEGILPPGPVGRLHFGKEREDSRQFAAVVRPFLTDDEQPPLSFDIDLKGMRLSGTIHGIRPGGLVQYRMARLKIGDLIGAWLNWLIFSLLNTEASVAMESVIIGLDTRGKTCRMRAEPVNNPECYLEPLVEIFREGLVRPLPFFPSASMAYIEALTGRKPETALQKAQGAWEGNVRYAEKDDPYFARCFGHTNPLSSEFASLCRAILLPVHEHYSKGAA